MINDYMINLFKIKQYPSLNYQFSFQTFSLKVAKQPKNKVFLNFQINLQSYGIMIK